MRVASFPRWVVILLLTGRLAASSTAPAEASGGVCEAELAVCKADLQTAIFDLFYCEVLNQDSDGDGEIDRTDRCPRTPAGEAVDAQGCSHAQFCANIDMGGPQASRKCRRADWRNDEPIRARDCRPKSVYTRGIWRLSCEKR